MAIIWRAPLSLFPMVWIGVSFQPSSGHIRCARDKPGFSRGGASRRRAIVISMKTKMGRLMPESLQSFSTKTSVCAAKKLPRAVVGGLRRHRIPLLAVAGCEKGQKAEAAPPDVEVVSVTQEDVPITRGWVATLTGFVKAQIRAQGRICAHLAPEIRGDPSTAGALRHRVPRSGKGFLATLSGARRRMEPLRFRLEEHDDYASNVNGQTSTLNAVT
jgi:hypothetical protein